MSGFQNEGPREPGVSTMTHKRALDEDDDDYDSFIGTAKRTKYTPDQSVKLPDGIYLPRRMDVG